MVEPTHDCCACVEPLRAERDSARFILAHSTIDDDALWRERAERAEAERDWLAAWHYTGDMRELKERAERAEAAIARVERRLHTERIDCACCDVTRSALRGDPVP